jgi:hypothetical protein
LGFLRVGWRPRGWKRGVGDAVGKGEGGAGSVRVLPVSSVGGAGGVRVADEPRADGSCGEGSKRAVGCVSQ